MSPLTHERISEPCEQLKLVAINDSYSTLAQEHVEAIPPLPDYLLSLLDAEYQARYTRNRQMLVRMSGLPAIKTLDDYDFKFAVGAPSKSIELLADLAFIARKENVILLGPSGVGKTHIATALGYLAA